MKKIVVVGGSGFIGTRLVDRLIARGDEVVIVDKVTSHKYPDKVMIADVRSVKQLRLAIPPCDVLVNLAAEHRDDVTPLSLYQDVNVGGAEHLAQVCVECGIRHMVFTSSVAVYGFAPLGTDESGAINPFNEYGRTKAEAEVVLRRWASEHSSMLTVIRPTVVFGERNRGNVYNLLRQIVSGHFLMIGEGTNRKSMAYVENVASFIMHRIDHATQTETFNYIDKPDFDMNELVVLVRRMMGSPASVGARLPYLAGMFVAGLFDVVAKLTGRKFPISRIRVKKFCCNSVYGTAVDQTGFVPPLKLEQALSQTVDFEFRQNSSGTGHVFYSE